MLETEKHKGDPIIMNNDFLFVTVITGLLASYLTLVGTGSKSGFCSGDMTPSSGQVATSHLYNDLHLTASV